MATAASLPGARYDRVSDQLLTAATKLFATQGYAATSVEQVAAVCRCGKDTIYRRFPSKAALFLAASTAQRERFFNLLPTVDGGEATGLEALRKTLREVLRTSLLPDMIAFNRIAIAEAQAFPEIAPASACEESPVTSLLADLVGQCQAHGSIRAGDRHFIAGQLLQAVTGVPVQLHLVGGDDFGQSAAQDRFFDLAWAAALGGVKP